MIATVLDQGGQFYTGEIDTLALNGQRVLVRMAEPLVPVANDEFKPISPIEWVSEIYLLPVRVISWTGAMGELYRDALAKLKEAHERNRLRQEKRLLT